MSLMQLASRILGKKVDAVKEKVSQEEGLPRQDDDLPLGIRIGSFITLPRARFAMLSETLIQVPELAQLEVISIGRLRVSTAQGLNIFRFYTDKGSAFNDRGQEYLQVAVNGSEILEVSYWRQLLRTIPDADEIEAYRGQGWGLGELRYTLGMDLLSNADADQAMLIDLIGDEGEFYYDRDAGGDANYVAPYVAEESRLDDPFGEMGQKQEVRFMPYVRDVSGGREMLMINFEDVNSVNGSSVRDLHVDYHIGIALDAQSIQVL